MRNKSSMMHFMIWKKGLKLHSSLWGVNTLACTPLVPFFPAGESVSSSPSPLPFSAAYQSLTDKRSVVNWKSQQSGCSVAVTRAVGFLLLVIILEVCVLWYHFPFYTWLGWVVLPWKLYSVNLTWCVSVVNNIKRRRKGVESDEIFRWKTIISEEFPRTFQVEPSLEWFPFDAGRFWWKSMGAYT